MAKKTRPSENQLHLDSLDVELLRRVQGAWLDKLKSQGFSKQIEKEIAQSSDLASLWFNSISEDHFDLDSAYKKTIRKLWQETYSIGNLYTEILNLKEAAIETVGLATELVNKGNQERISNSFYVLDELFAKCLNETSVIYESIFEQSSRGCCHVDFAGKILYANSAFHELVGLGDVIGHQLTEFFPTAQQIIQDALEEQQDTTQSQQNIVPLITRTLLRKGNKNIPVTAEFGPIFVEGKRIGGYSTITDISVFNAERRVYEKSPLGIIRVDKDNVITYANKEASTILGLPAEKIIIDKKKFKDFFSAEDQKIIDQHLKRRPKGEGDEYKLNRLPDGRALPLHVIAIPEVDNRNTWIDTFAIIRALDVETTINRIHEANLATSTLEQLLDDTLKAIRDLIPFEFAIAGIFNKTMEYWKSIYDYPRKFWETNWLPVTSEQGKWLSRSGTKKTIPDLKSSIQSQSNCEYLGNTTIKNLYEEDFNSALIFPINQGVRLVAIILLFSKEPKYFGDRHWDLITKLKLPIADVINSILSIMQRNENEFIHKLLQRIAESVEMGSSLSRTTKDKPVSMQKPAIAICEELTRFYKWDSVSIFKVLSDQFELLAQNAETRKGYRLPENHKQPIRDGLLGEAYFTNKPLIENDVINGSLANKYKKTCDKTKSELVFPIEIMGRIVWLLNIEDAKLNAFCPEDLETLEKIVSGLRPVLEGGFARTVLEYAWDVASDGIIMTDIDGKIIDANQAAERMLKMPRDQLVELHFVKNFVADAERASVIEEPEGFGPEIVKLKISQQLSLPIRLSSRILLDYSRREFFLEDLTELEQRTRLEALSGALYDIAVQTRLPLSLGMSILRKLQPSTDPNTVEEVVKKSLNQLSKAERAFERIALYGQTGERISESFRSIVLKGFFDDVFDGFSPEECNIIDIQDLEVAPNIRGDHYQLEFVFQTILDYLLRFNPPAGKIQIKVEPQDSDFIAFHISGVADEGFDEAMEGSSADPTLRARAEVALAENFLRRFIERNHGGTYQKEKSDNQLIFTIRLPVT
jgi:PAS domain S-box-containing protein